MYDRYGDQWNGTGANVTITSGGNVVLNTTHGGGSSSTANFNVYGGGSACVSGPQEIDIYGNGVLIADNDASPRYC
ncbi:hypothetical protein JCM19298_678 [Nonlabens ulvanivorans]|nr:hypothetical protein JCM19298_678 [Nonlabens ulvanivorans]